MILEDKTNQRNSKRQTIHAADLFAGAGGTSSGLVQAVNSLGFEISLLAINHWDLAIATHTHNHNQAKHLCQSLDTINPQDLVPGRRLHLLVASPECTDHSVAKGGKPRSDQKRADAWLLLRWIEKLYVENILIENVKEFQNWGPLNARGLPDKRHRGLYFRQFIETLKINYNVEYRVLCAADYGDATTRERLFILCRRPKHKAIFFPEPTHASRKAIAAATKQPDFFGSQTARLKPWRAAREIINWDLKGESIFNRKRPLSENTMRRIFAGLYKYSLKAFVLPNEGFYRGNAARDVDEPFPTVTSRGAGALVEPFIVGAGGTTGQQSPRDIDKPLQTVPATLKFGLVEPYLLNLKGSARLSRSIDEPTFTQAGGNTQCLVEPFLIKYFTGSNACSVDEPLPTVTANYEHLAVCEPFIVPCNHGTNDKRTHSIDEPLPTVTGVDAWAMAEPFLVGYRGNHAGKTDGDNRSYSIDEPLRTQDTSNRFAVATPYLIKVNNYAGARSIDEPLETPTKEERRALFIPQLNAVIDIKFRMLQPEELAASMSFPKSYHFMGTRDQKVKQIGNAVPVKLAEALCRSLLMDAFKTKRYKHEVNNYQFTNEAEFSDE